MEYKEIQKFNTKWLIAFIIFMTISSSGIFGYGFVQQIIYKIPFGDRPMSDTGIMISFIISAIINVAIVYLTLKTKLITSINENYISYRFIPFHLKNQIIKWEDIDKFEVRQYQPVKEYGGWGIRYGNFKYGKAYNIKGNKGLQLYLKNNKKVLIGTQNDMELNEFLNNLSYQWKNYKTNYSVKLN